MYSIANLLY